MCALGVRWVPSVHLQATPKAAWAICGRKSAAEKFPRTMTPPTTDGVSPLHQIVGNISTRRRITRKSLRSDRRPVSLCEPLCAVLPGTAGTDTGQGREGGFGLVFEGLRGTKRKAGESEWVVTTHSRSQTPAVRTFSEFHFWVMTRLQKRFLGCKIKNP